MIDYKLYIAIKEILETNDAEPEQYAKLICEFLDKDIGVASSTLEYN
jgi:hypothetical protein